MNNRLALRFLLALSIAITAITAVWAVFPTPEESGIYDGFVRLHVLANSDLDADQNVKLMVRDRVLALTEEITAGCSNSDEVAAAFKRESEYLRREAERTLAENGFDYGARVEIGLESYPTRMYENVRLPAGVYSSVRILLGEGEGKNWWCILFPPLCTNIACVRDEMIEAGFTEGQMKLVTGGEGRYKLKFRILEILAELFGER